MADDLPEGWATPDEALKSLRQNFARLSSAQEQLEADVAKHRELVLLAASKGPAAVQELLNPKAFLTFVHMLALAAAYSLQRDDFQGLRAKFEGLPPA